MMVRLSKSDAKFVTVLDQHFVMVILEIALCQHGHG